MVHVVICKNSQLVIEKSMIIFLNCSLKLFSLIINGRIASVVNYPLPGICVDQQLRPSSYISLRKFFRCSSKMFFSLTTVGLGQLKALLATCDLEFL